MPSKGSLIIWVGKNVSGTERVGIVTEVNEDHNEGQVSWAEVSAGGTSVTTNSFYIPETETRLDDVIDFNEFEGEHKVGVVIFPTTYLGTHLLLANWTCNLEEKKRTTQASANHGAYPLKLTPFTRRDAGASAKLKKAQLTKIVEELDVENVANLRYVPIAGGDTYCNIYGYDYCYLAGVYLPRVWWNTTVPSLVDDLMEGKIIAPNPRTNCVELNANRLVEWFANWGSLYGWKQIYQGSVDGVNFDNFNRQLQEKANLGCVCVIIARHGTGHGHVAVVPPETDTQLANLSADGAPLMSMAGRNPRRYTSTRWWDTNFADDNYNSDEYAEIALYYHD